MTGKIFRLRPQTQQCRESLCLAEYEEAWLQHQQIQFRRAGQGGEGFEKFRARVWGKASYAEGMKIQVHGRHGQIFSWSDVAASGRIEYSDVQSLMELGLVEFLVPTHRCISSRVSPNLIVYPVRSRRDFLTMVKGMQELRPLHGEGAGNVFWPICLPDETLQGAPPPPPPALPFVFGSEEEEDEVCDGGEIDYFDEDLDQAICEEGEAVAWSGTFKSGLGALLSGSASYGLGLALAVGAEEFGRVAAASE
ncbi:MAG TPA: hypothetical protein VJR29_04325 [bacterium]|nr:hypothetical protein [bacterium]